MAQLLPLCRSSYLRSGGETMVSVNAITAKTLVVALFSLAVLAQASLAQAGGGTGPGPCCFEVSNPILTIEKLVNGQDADAAPGIILPIDSLVTFTYDVRNLGTGFGVPAGDIRVRDDNETPGLPGDDFFPALTVGIGDPFLDPGDLWIFSATGPALPGLHTNVGALERFFLVLGNPEGAFLVL